MILSPASTPPHAHLEEAACTARTDRPSSSLAANTKHSLTRSSLPPCASHDLARKYHASLQSHPCFCVSVLSRPWARSTLVGGGVMRYSRARWTVDESERGSQTRPLVKDEIAKSCAPRRSWYSPS